MVAKFTSRLNAISKKVEAAIGTNPGRGQDWTCTACSCTGNWASRGECRRCGAPRPAGAGVAAAQPARQPAG
eukprot:6911051-Lingulodinium_polyedra.AAC.1